MGTKIDHTRNGIFSEMNLKYNSKSTVCHELRKMDRDCLEQLFRETKARQELEELLSSKVLRIQNQLGW